MFRVLGVFILLFGSVFGIIYFDTVYWLRAWRGVWVALPIISLGAAACLGVLSGRHQLTSQRLDAERLLDERLRKQGIHPGESSPAASAARQAFWKTYQALQEKRLERAAEAQHTPGMAEERALDGLRTLADLVAPLEGGVYIVLALCGAALYLFFQCAGTSWIYGASCVLWLGVLGHYTAALFRATRDRIILREQARELLMPTFRMELREEEVAGGLSIAEAAPDAGALEIVEAKRGDLSET